MAQCPRDSNVTLLMMERNGVTIDYCPTCRGIWLDHGELEKILQRESDELEREARMQAEYERRQMERLAPPPGVPQQPNHPSQPPQPVHPPQGHYPPPSPYGGHPSAYGYYGHKYGKYGHKRKGTLKKLFDFLD